MNDDDNPDDPQRLADELLAIRCQLGERAAFDALIARWHKPLWRYARNLTGQDAAADDATQETWLRVLRGIARLREPARLRSWLFGIAHRVLMDRLRQQYAQPQDGEADIDAIAAPVPPDDEFDLDALRQALAALPLVENEVLTLFYLQELALGDVAQALDIPVGTVKSRLFRARKLLRHQLTIQGVSA
jgi:RNA polymerase sigma factor (sigma-70 family)